MRSMIDREVWRKTERKNIPSDRRLIETSGYSRSREMELTGQD